MPIEGVVLTMKAMGVDTVINFPFPSQPERSKLSQAEKTLVHLGALKESANDVTSITNLGRSMNFFPLAPRYAKMLVVGNQHGCLPYIIAIVSALSIGDPFISEPSLLGDKNVEKENDRSEESIKVDLIIEPREQSRKDYFLAIEVSN
jgi:ATP-dependent RNA helicase DHX37/DHR1